MNEAQGHADPGGDQTPDGLTVTATPPHQIEFPDSTIGRYKILDQLGEGGMGMVYLAEQTTPVRRRVALKVIKLGMDTRQVIARFEAERQALAMMEHPNIARALDAGATESGRPYFVMELVRGRPITDYCDANRLNTRQRLELFLPVCQAIQHAHHKGVIHRDIKPSNVLVRMRDGAPVPTVIDFGIAKATHQNLSDGAPVTQVQQFVGTPAYMSPEQAEPSGIDVDTRTDVYSLGLLLYELLTGRPPFDPQRLRTAGFEEAARIIRDEDPARPSAVLTGSADGLAALADRRRTTPAALHRAIRGDLDWIVMRAIEKDRTRRYDNPLELAADVTRHLHGEPVLAGPPSVHYRLGKHLSRYRVPIGLGAAAVAVLAAAFVVTAVKWREAVAAERSEVQQRLIAEDATRRVESALSEAQEQRASAEAEASQNATVVGFLHHMLALANPTSPSDLTAPRTRAAGSPLERDVAPLEITLAQVLQHAGRYIIPSVSHEPKVEGTVRYILGSTFADVGLDFQAEHNLHIAYRLRRQELGDDHPDTLRALAKLGQRLRYADHAQFMLSTASKGMARVLGPDHPETLVVQSWFGERLLNNTRWHPLALDVLVDALARQQTSVGWDHPQTLWTMRLKAEALWRNGETKEAIRTSTEALAAAERAGLTYIVSDLHLVMADALAQGDPGERAEAVDHADLAIAAAEAAYGRQSFPYVRTVQRASEALYRAGAYDAAEQTFRSGIERWELGRSGTDDRLIELYRSFEWLLERRGQDPTDVRTDRLALLDRLAERGGAEAANAWRTDAYIRENSGAFSAAGDAYQVALDVSRRSWPDEDRLETAWALHGLANAAWAEGQLEQAERFFRESIEIRTRLYGADGTESLILLEGLTELLVARGDRETALPLVRLLCDGLAPRHPYCAYEYAAALNLLARIQIDLGRINDADATAARMMEVVESMPGPWAAFASGAQSARAVRAVVDARQGRYAQAEQPLKAVSFGLAWSVAVDPRQAAHRLWFVSQTAEMYRRWVEEDPTPEREQEARKWANLEASLTP